MAKITSSGAQGEFVRGDGTFAPPGSGGQLGTFLAPAVAVLAFATQIQVNAQVANVFSLTLTASTATMQTPSNPADGQKITLRVTQGGSGSYTLAFTAGYDFGTAGAPTLSTTVGKVDVLGFEYNAALGSWCCLGSALGF